MVCAAVAFLYIIGAYIFEIVISHCSFLCDRWNGSNNDNVLERFPLAMAILRHQEVSSSCTAPWSIAASDDGAGERVQARAVLVELEKNCTSS
jgi:hypothetical protein